MGVVENIKTEATEVKDYLVRRLVRCKSPAYSCPRLPMF